MSLQLQQAVILQEKNIQVRNPPHCYLIIASCIFLNTVTIEKASPASSDFKGFMCQVRAADGSSTTARGSFESFNTGKAHNLACTTSKVKEIIVSAVRRSSLTFQGAVTHKNGNAVSSFSATWKAPSPGAGQLKALLVTPAFHYFTDVQHAAFIN